MSDVQSLIKMLQSNDPNKRYDACEQLRVSPSLPPEALEMLRMVANDTNPDVADAAQRALKLHLYAEESLQPSKVGDTPHKSDEKTNKARDIVVGFFGWILFNNIYFILILILSLNVALPQFGDFGLLVYFGLPAVIVPLVFFAQRKRIWIGIVVAMISNVVLWAIFGAVEPQYYLLPFPLGFIAMMQ